MSVQGHLWSKVTKRKKARQEGSKVPNKQSVTTCHGLKSSKCTFNGCL